MVKHAREFNLLLLAIILIHGLSSCHKATVVAQKTEIYLINNTRHTFTLRYIPENVGQDTLSIIPPDAQFCITKISSFNGSDALVTFIDHRMLKLIDENNIEWMPRISESDKWGEINLPAEEGARQLFFIVMNPMDDGLNRLQNLGLIRLFRISQALAYLILLSSVVGLFYVHLRFKYFYVLLALFLNFPLIYFTADFGYMVSYSFEPMFIIPTWVFDSAPYFVRFSIPVGAIIVWILLISREVFRKNRK